jgi:hypothetical protein
MFGSLPAAAPGEVVQIDSTPLDVLVLLDDGVAGRVELTGMIDVATRVVPAAVLRPTTRSVDASVLLARALTPQPVRPGWPEALKMAHSVLPYQRLLWVDARLEHAAARPVIVPDTIVIDHGSVLVSAAFRSACRHPGIWIQPAQLGSGSEKGHIERSFGSVASLFCQFVSGYAGRSPDRRGRHVEDQPLWSVSELQELLDEWLVSVWMNRPHDGLRDPEHPGRAFTPNQKYAALIEAAGLRARRAWPRRLHPAAARFLAGGQRLRQQAEPAQLRQRGAEPTAAAAVRGLGEEAPVGGPPRSL